MAGMGKVAAGYLALMEAGMSDKEVVEGFIFGKDFIGDFTFGIDDIDGQIKHINRFITRNKIEISARKKKSIDAAKSGHNELVDTYERKAKEYLADMIIYVRALEVLERVKTQLQQSVTAQGGH